MKDCILSSIFLIFISSIYGQVERQDNSAAGALPLPSIFGKTDFGIDKVNENGAYLRPEFPPIYKYGSEALDSIIANYRISRKSFDSQNTAVVELEFVVNSSGLVIQNSLKLSNGLDDHPIKRSLLYNKAFMNDWLPAIHKGQRVSAVCYVPLIIE